MKLRPLLDTNVLIDLALSRPGLHEASGAVVAWSLNHPGSTVVAVHSLATVNYLMGRETGAAKAREFIGDLVPGIDIAQLDTAGVSRALDLPLPDFEDALIAAAAESAAATHIVTRNLPDFRKSPVKAVTPEDFLRLTARV
jgi:predicted nucleic acid-binding protein